LKTLPIRITASVPIVTQKSSSDRDQPIDGSSMEFAAVKAVKISETAVLTARMSDRTAREK
jgi:hypothetical protein